jgi:hypothetical protein
LDIFPSPPFLFRGGADTVDVAVALRLALMLEKVECRVQ